MTLNIQISSFHKYPNHTERRFSIFEGIKIEDMITCYVNYKIDPDKLEEFEHYAKLWIPLVNKFGGTHHGYFLPHEGANNVAMALFSFESLAKYEVYRTDSMEDPDCIAAYDYAKKTKCIVSYERNFMRPVLET